MYYFIVNKYIRAVIILSLLLIVFKDKGNNVRMLSTTSVNGFTILTYQRKLGAADIYDRTILTNGSQPVIWAVGQIMNGEPGCFSLYNKGWCQNA